MGVPHCTCNGPPSRKVFDNMDEQSKGSSSSRVSFKSQKIVTTISTRAKKHRHRKSKSKSSTRSHKHGPSKKRPKSPIVISEPSGDTVRTLASESSVMAQNSLSSMDEMEFNMNTTYILYREGYAQSPDSREMTPVHTITRGYLPVMDISGGSDILTNRLQLNHILSRTPSMYHHMKWKCFYSLLRDGCSMQTFYGNTRNFEQSILIIQDQNKNVFGTFLDTKWKSEQLQYNGSKDCFVFRFAFDKNEYSIFEYHSTGEKPYFLQSDYEKGITVGAGECPAIYIAGNLLIGRSTASDTFGNSEPLTENSIFQISNVEVWCPTFE